jgi:hypothetical protein
MTDKDKKRLKNLEFYYISEIRDGIYEKIYAKKQSDKGVKAHLVDDDRVAFWDNTGDDHACVVDIKDILMAP